MLGYDFFTMKSGSCRALHGINLQTGESKWGRDVLYKNEWNDYYPISDSVLIIASAGLHSINLKNGNGWSQDIKTESSTKIPTSVGLGIALTLVRFPYSPRNIETDVSGICSNILVKDSLIYFAATQGLYCYRVSNGELIWLAPLDEKYSSHSILTTVGDNISLCNIGYADNQGSRYSVGKPFLSSYDPITGKENFLILTNLRSDVLDIHIDSKSSSIYFLSTNKVVRYSTITGRVENSRIFDLYEQHPIERFVHIKLYELDTVDFTTFFPLKNSNVVAYVPANEDLIAMNSNLNITQTLKPKSCYWLAHENENYKVFANEEEAILTKSNYKRIAYLNIGPESVLHKNIVYDYFDKSLHKINLSSIDIE